MQRALIIKLLLPLHPIFTIHIKSNFINYNKQF